MYMEAPGRRSRIGRSKTKLDRCGVQRPERGGTGKEDGGRRTTDDHWLQ